MEQDDTCRFKTQAVAVRQIEKVGPHDRPRKPHRLKVTLMSNGDVFVHGNHEVNRTIRLSNDGAKVLAESILELLAGGGFPLTLPEVIEDEAEDSS